MVGSADRKVVLVTRQTRLEELVARFHTIAQAKFYVEHSGADFSDYEREHGSYLNAKQVTLGTLQTHGRYQAVDRSFLPNFLFGKNDIVVALGQDGLVANTMKYLQGQPLLGVNPEPARYDGILLPFEPHDLSKILGDVLLDRYTAKDVTMAKAALANGQELYAVNDFFIGPKSHTSARYELHIGDTKEVQSSSGLIVSTGLGSTAWMKSIVTGALQIRSVSDKNGYAGLRTQTVERERTDICGTRTISEPTVIGNRRFWKHHTAASAETDVVDARQRCDF